MQVVSETMTEEPAVEVTEGEQEEDADREGS